MSTRTVATFALTSFLFAGCAVDGVTDFDNPNANPQGTGNGSSRYMVSCVGELPAGFADTVAANGDNLLHSMPEAGLALVQTANPTAYEIGSCDVAEDFAMQWTDPVEVVELDQEANPPSAGDDEWFYYLQWGHDAVNAAEAWNAGVRGQGARVAVLDTGFDLTHPDLVPNINFDLSKDFTGEGLQYTLADPFSHGTHTAGTIAAADNAFGSIGVAPDAELVLVKVLGDEGSGSFYNIMAGIIYAADVDSDVISMSLGGYICNSWEGGGKFIAALNRVVNYAGQKGSLVIASAGNDGYDLDHLWDCEHLPSDLSSVVSTSATAPIARYYDPNGSLDNPASYTNYGQSEIAFAAPGGDFQIYGYNYWWYDMVLSTGNGGWYWSAGTSMATPHAAGIAALIISEGGNSSPAHVLAEMRSRADDLGKPGNDDYYGAGRVSSGY